MSKIPLQPTTPVAPYMNYESTPTGPEDQNAGASFCHPLSVILGVMCCPITVCSCYSIQEREEAVILRYGKFAGVEKQPGLHWFNMWGRDLRKISTKVVSVDIPTTKTADLNGNPLVISGVLVYQISNPKKAVLDVENARVFIMTQAQATLKQVVARYPYETVDDSNAHTHSLKSESGAIGQEFCQVLQSRVLVAGAVIKSFAFNEISYAPEIAAGMLKKQQANATIAARRVIVQGAVDIAHGAIMELEHRKLTLDPASQSKLISNVLTVMCSDRDAQPTVPL